MLIFHCNIDFLFSYRKGKRSIIYRALAIKQAGAGNRGSQYLSNLPNDTRFRFEANFAFGTKSHVPSLERL